MKTNKQDFVVAGEKDDQFYFSFEFHDKYLSRFYMSDSIHIQQVLSILMRDTKMNLLVNSLKDFEVIEWDRGQVRDERVTFTCKICGVNPVIHCGVCVDPEVGTVDKIIFMKFEDVINDNLF